MIKIDEGTSISIDSIDSKIILTIKVQKNIKKIICLEIPLELKVADKIISKLVSERAKN